MKQPTPAAQRVVFNTGILYAKMLITMGISLYSVRLVLEVLGASDYGIFNLIAGVIAMLSFLNTAMTVSTQRYLSYHQGTGDFDMQKKIFINSWVLHILIGLIVIVLLVAFSPLFFDGFLNIPADRISSAKVVYYFMTVSVFFTIIAVPFTASLNAHENMLWIAIVMIIESVLKLLIALSLGYFGQTERLIVYGLLMAGITIVSFALYALFCLKWYNECSVKIYKIDKPLIKELSGFVGWNLFGTFAAVGRNQGLAILLNVFFGAIVNAAYGIANQVASQVQFFSGTMLRALNPQIMKSEGMNDRPRMLRLSMTASKFGFFLVAIFAIPCIFEMPTILKLWLKNVPENTVVFCDLILIGTLFAQLTIGLQTAFQTVGKIKKYQIVVGGLIILNVPIGYLLLKFNLPPYIVFVSYVVLEIIASVIRLFLLKKIAGLSIMEYMNKVCFKIIIPVVLSVILCYCIVCFVELNFRFLLTIFVSVMFFCIEMYIFGLCRDEKQIINSMVRKIVLKKTYLNRKRLIF
jgi:O-antigen/teichoic acid export membrane protein